MELCAVTSTTDTSGSEFEGAEFFSVESSRLLHQKNVISRPLNRVSICLHIVRCPWKLWNNLLVLFSGPVGDVLGRSQQATSPLR